MKASTEKDDQNIIQFSRFVKIVKEHGLELSNKDNELLMKAFVSNQDRNNVKININKLYNLKTVKKIKRIYDNVDLYEEQDNPDLVDNSGYLGLFYREKIPLEAISQPQLIQIFKQENKLVQIMKIIKEIDRDNNGYVTNQELEDIFRVQY